MEAEAVSLRAVRQILVTVLPSPAQSTKAGMAIMQEVEADTMAEGEGILEAVVPRICITSYPMTCPTPHLPIVYALGRTPNTTALVRIVVVLQIRMAAW
jgi:hypothetical protein